MNFYQFVKGDRVYTVTFKNDIVFKKIIGDDDSASLRLTLINGLTGLQIERLDILNKEELGVFIQNKKAIIDVMARDEQGRHYLIEMQRGLYGPNEDHRFQFYPSLDLVDQIRQGDQYNNVHEIILFVFTEDDYSNETVNKYQFRKENGELLRNSLISLIIVSLPKVKLKKHMKDYEIILYIFQNGITHDIMEVANKNQKRWIRHMENKYLETTLRDYFTETQLASLNESIIQDQLVEYGRRLNHSFEQELLNQKEQLEHQYQIQEEQHLMQSVQVLSKKLNISYEEAMEMLGLDSKTKEAIRKEMVEE